MISVDWLWLEPTLATEVSAQGAIRVVIVEPDSLKGREVVGVSAAPCGLRRDPHTVCGLVRGHYGGCWACSEDLVIEAGPFAIVRVRP